MAARPRQGTQGPRMNHIFSRAGSSAPRSSGGCRCVVVCSVSSDCDPAACLMNGAQPSRAPSTHKDLGSLLRFVGGPITMQRQRRSSSQEEDESSRSPPSVRSGEVSDWMETTTRLAATRPGESRAGNIDRAPAQAQGVINTHSSSGGGGGGGRKRKCTRPDRCARGEKSLTHSTAKYNSSFTSCRVGGCCVAPALLSPAAKERPPHRSLSGPR